jgi:hypothetical protein
VAATSCAPGLTDGSDSNNNTLATALIDSTTHMSHTLYAANAVIGMQQYLILSIKAAEP